jgi:hypothetical protein
MADHAEASTDNETRDLPAGFGAMSDVSGFRAIVESTGEELDRELRTRSDPDS